MAQADYASEMLVSALSFPYPVRSSGAQNPAQRLADRLLHHLQELPPTRIPAPRNKIVPVQATWFIAAKVQRFDSRKLRTHFAVLNRPRFLNTPSLFTFLYFQRRHHSAIHLNPG